MLEERVRDILVNVGLQEVMTYSLTTAGAWRPLGLARAEYIRLANPISSERVVMRRSVLASVLEVAAANLRHTEEVRLFEIGCVYLPRPVSVPNEPRRLAIVLTGRGRSNPGWSRPRPLDFFDLKGIVENLTEPARRRSWLPTAEAPFCTLVAPRKYSSAESLGHFRQLHPSLNETYHLGRPNGARRRAGPGSDARRCAGALWR